MAKYLSKEMIFLSREMKHLFQKLQQIDHFL